MSASTLTRDVWTDDTGTAEAPNEDGTILDNDVLQAIFDRIDQLFAGAGAYTTFTFGGLIAAEGLGNYVFSAGGSGGQIWTLRNTSAGSGNYSEYRLGNDATASAARLRQTTTTWSASGIYAQDATILEAARAGGLAIAATHASGTVRFFAGGTTERARLSATRWSVWTSGTLPSAQSLSTDQAVFGAWDGPGDASVGIFGTTRGVLLLGGNTAGAIAGVGSLKFVHGQRSQTDENAASIATIQATNVGSTPSAYGGELAFATRPDAGALTTRFTLLSTGHLEPFATNTYDLGTASAEVRRLYAREWRWSQDADTYMAWAASGATINAFQFVADGVTAVSLYRATATAGYGLGLISSAFGAGAVTGSWIGIGRNTSGNGAAGYLSLVAKNGTIYHLWVDATGDLRVHTSPPTEDGTTVSDTAGTVVGAQS